jgi:PAS domain S-box-containing protein
VTSILVVDDRPADRELLVRVLESVDYTMLDAATGESAMEIARAERPDVVIADILMPSMDGYELVRELRGDPATANVTVVFCTATYAVDEVRRLADACGVEHILTKPCSPQEILRVVARALASSQEPAAEIESEEFQREHLRVLNRTLVHKMEELETAERHRAESLTLLETLLSTAPVGFGYVDRELRLRRVNGTLAAVSGVPLEEQLDRTMAEAVPDLWPQIEPVFRRVLETGDAVLNQEIHDRGSAAAGQGRAWLASYYPVRTQDEIIGIGIVAIDITERREADEFRAVVVENMAEGLCVADAEGRVTFMNAAASRMLGWSETELLGESLHDATHFQHADGSPYLAHECELLKARDEGRTVRTLDDAFTRKDGSILPVSCSASPLLSGNSVRGIVVVFRDTTDEAAERGRVQRELDSLSWVGRIRDALDEGRMNLYSQPIVPLNGGQPAEELLLRMVGPTGEVILPGRFLPVAEKYGLITEIDEWVIAQAVRLAASGRRVQANLSAASMGRAELLPLIEQELRTSGAEPANLVFEITETALMHDIAGGEVFARAVADIGCELAIDDFGTGFGSFTYVKRLPVRYLKIDLEFVIELIPNPANQHVVKAIVNLARGFGQKTIAEGVEDAETLELLREFGVDFVQGYHLGRPAPLEAWSMPAVRTSSPA